MTTAYEAMMFAREVHKDQRRKYTNNPYADHLAEVAGIVAAAGIGADGDGEGRETAIAVAWLHDSVEDCGVTLHQIQCAFGWVIRHGVAALSDMETGNRAERKAASRARLSAAPGWVQSIKCADLISNTSSIVQHDPKFAAVYLEEKRLLLAVMDKADRRLHALAMAQAQGERHDQPQP